MQAYSPTWQGALQALDLHTTQTTTPAGEQHLWYEALLRFGTRGFLLVFLRPEADRLMARVECALPQHDQPDAFVQRLSAHARAHGGDPHVTTLGPPVVVKITFAADLDEARARDWLTMMLKLADYLSALERDCARAVDPLLAATQPEAASAASPPPHEDAPAARPSPDAPAARPVGADAPAARPIQAQAPDIAPSHAFEVIGHAPIVTPPQPAAVAASSGAASGNARLAAFSVRREGEALSARVWLGGVPDAHIATIERGLRRAMRVRLDAEVQREPSTGDEQLSLRLSPTHRDDADDVAYEATRMFERLVALGELGADLFTALDLPRETQTMPETFETATTVRDLPTLKRDHAQSYAPQPSSAPAAAPREPVIDAGVVLDLSAPPEAGAPLTPGKFDDPRLKRPDATTTLVDVVLRHPGFSDKRIGQVLNILLSIESRQARQLADSAPCVIAWGIGRERAMTFRDVIEGAGGKVLLAEPGTFGQQ